MKSTEFDKIVDRLKEMVDVPEGKTEPKQPKLTGKIMWWDGYLPDKNKVAEPQKVIVLHKGQQLPYLIKAKNGMNYWVLENSLSPLPKPVPEPIPEMVTITIPIIGTVGDGGKVTFYSNPTVVTCWDAMDNESSYSFNSEPDLQRIVRETGLGTDEGAWVVKVEREGGLPDSFAHLHIKKWSSDWEALFLYRSELHHSKGIIRGDLPGRLRAWIIFKENESVEKAIVSTIDAYWTAIVGEMKIRAYETDRNYIKVMYGSGEYQYILVANDSDKSQQDADVLRALLEGAKGKIMPYALNKGKYPAPKE